MPKCDNCIAVRDPYATGDHWYTQYECTQDKHCLGECQQCGDEVPTERQNKLPPSKDRWKLRSKTYQGIANAMAEQWGIF